jgi:hypothetical protein
MGRAKNTIKKSDISSAPIKVKYSNAYASQSLLDYGITTNRGTYTIAPKKGTTAYKYRNNYAVIRQLYYQNYLTGSIIGSASYWDPSIQSTAASGSLDDDNREFPGAVGSNIGFLAIPSRQFGEQISRKTFKIAPTDNVSYNIIDDGNGNIIDTFNNNIHVGNILYAQGIVTFTHPDYFCLLLNNNFGVTIDIQIDPSPTPTPTITATPSITPTITATPSITATPGLTATVTPSITTTVTPSVTATPSITPTKTATPSISITPSLTPTKTATPSLTPTITPSTSPQPNLYLTYAAGGIIGTNSWDVRYSATDIETLNAAASSTNSTTTSKYSAGPLGISSGTVVTIEVRKTSDSGNMEDDTGFDLYIDTGGGWGSPVSSFQKTTANNPIGPSTYTNITADLGNQIIYPGNKIKLVISEG